MNASSLWKERVLKEAGFCKWIFKHILPALVQSRASASLVEVSRIVGVSGMPVAARKPKPEPVPLLV